MSKSSGDFDYDVIIVGGGPAGVSCAITVAQKGYKVCILDKKKREKIGDKTCGDAIDKAALERLHDRIGIEYPHGDEVSDPISKMSIAADEIDLKITLDAPGFLVDRLIYGQRLLAHAEELGVEIIASAPVRGIITENIDGEMYVSGVSFHHEGQQKQLRGKFTIDASGAYASVRKELPDELLLYGIKRELADHELWPTYREIVELTEKHKNHRWREEIVLMFDDDYPPPGYFWIFSKGEGKLNAGIGWEKTQDLGKLKERYKEEFDKYYGDDDYTVIKRGGGQIPFRPPFDNLVFNGGALAGDAACVVHPVTAEGHGPALDTASHLGQTICQALEKDDRSLDALWQYNVDVAAHYGRKHTEAQIMKNFLSDVGASGLKYLIERKIFKEDELNLVFSGGALELSLLDQLKRVFKLLPKPRIMFGLKRVLSASDMVKKIYGDYPTSPSDIDNWRERRNKQLGLDF